MLNKWLACLTLCVSFFCWELPAATGRGARPHQHWSDRVFDRCFSSCRP